MRDASGVPVADVTISAGSGRTATTGSNGHYTLSVPAGRYIVSATKLGYTFNPPSRTVDVSADVTGQDFTATVSTVPDNEGGPVPGRPTQSRTVGKVTVYANSFSGSATSWTATGTVWIGPYTIVEEGSVTATGSTLSGKGVVSMITAANGSRRTTLFRDDFGVNASTGVLTPRFVSGHELRLKNLVGFRITQDAYRFSIDVLQGRMAGTLKLAVVIPQNNLVKEVSFALDHNGATTGRITDAKFTLGRVTLSVEEATLGADGIALKRAALDLPATLGGSSAALSVGNARITRDRQLILGSGSVTVNFPNIRVGGEKGFRIEGAKATLSLENGTYLFSGAGTFVLPGVGAGSGGCGIGTSFKLASSPPPLREASLSLKGCFKIPLANTGFFLTSVNGKVQLDERSVAIDVGIGIEGGPEIPGLGAAISGNPSAHWDTSWEVGLKGNLNVFRWQAAQAELRLNPREGLIGTLHISVLGVVEGDGRLHVWKDTSGFHFAGRSTVDVQIAAGAILKKCVGAFGAETCVLIPPTKITGPDAQADFGQFRTPSSNAAYGMKGEVNVLGYNPAFFVDVNRNVRFDLNGLQGYDLVDQVSRQSSPAQASGDAVYKVNVGTTPTLIVAMGSERDGLSLTLTDPQGTQITSTSGDPAVFYTSTVTQTLYTVSNPRAGEWTVTVSNITADDNYLLEVLGARVAPAIPEVPSLVANGTGYTVALRATGAPTATYSLFYDDNASGNDGKPIAVGLPLSKRNVAWDTRTVPEGDYYVYALLDDPFHAPVVAYSNRSVPVRDDTPPTTPTGMQVTVEESRAVIKWQPNTEPNVVGYRIYYREPGSGQTFVTDIPGGGQTKYTQQGLYLSGVWEMAISAYDVNGNQSPRNAPIKVMIGKVVPAVPQLRSPSDGATFDANQVVALSWTAVDQATDYTAQVAGGPDGVITVDWQAGTTATLGQLAEGTYAWRVKARNGTIESDWSQPRQFTVKPRTMGLQYYPLSSPIRLLDTRVGFPACDNPGAPLGQDSTTRVQAARTNCTGIPADAQAIVGNATVVNRTAESREGYLTLYPSDAARPEVSNLNYIKDQIVPNAFTVGLDDQGRFSIFTVSRLDFVVDITGYYAPPRSSGLYYYPLPRPVRLLDTRAGLPACENPGAPVGPDGIIEVPVVTDCSGIPSDAQAVVGNATVVNRTPESREGYLTLYPCAGIRPEVSNLNYVPGQIVPNAFTVGLDDQGRFCIFTVSRLDVLVDIAGYYSDRPVDTSGRPGLLYQSLQSPVRLLETRSGLPGCENPGSPLEQDSTRVQAARTNCTGVPANAQAIVGNATVVNRTPQAREGYLTLYPSNASRPEVSNLNYVPGQIVPNAFTVGLDNQGHFSIFTVSQLDFLVDITGYFLP